MEVNEFNKRRRKLEEDISNQVSKLINNFKKETDFYPFDINIQIIDATGQWFNFNSYHSNRIISR